MRSFVAIAMAVAVGTAASIALGSGMSIGPSPTPATLPLSGAAGGDLTGTFPNPTLVTTGVGAGGPTGNAAAVPVITYDAKGRLTAVSTAGIAIAASAITSGTLGVANGGTGIATLGTGLQVLRTNAGATALEYATPTTGTVTSIGSGAGLSGGPITGSGTLATDSTEADFFASGALTCGAATRGKAQVHTTPLQYCDNAATPTLRYSAYADSAGAATELTCSGCVAASELASTAVSAASYTNASLTVDAQGRLTAASSGTAPLTAVSVVAPLTSTGGLTPTLSTSIGTAKLTGRTTAATGVMEEIAVDTTLSLAALSLGRAALTGDVTASAGSNATTLATVNGNVGSFGSATQAGTFTVNGKGLVTAAASTSIALAASAITSGTLAVQRGGTGIDTGASTGVAIVNGGTWSIPAVLGVSRGGTNGTAVPTTGGVGYGTGSALAYTAAGATTTVLHGSVSAPTFSSVSMTADVSGTLPVGNGGTGAATFAANNVLLGNTTSAFQVVAPGTSGNVLTSNGTTWASAAAAAGLTGFTGAESTASPNNTVYADSITASGASTNADAIIKPKGSGAILGHIPDSTSAGGNKRGAYAVDFQTSRGAASNVASGQWSFLGSGQSNTVSGSTTAVVVGGLSNTASCDYCFVGGGQSNLASASNGGDSATIAGGWGNTASGNVTAIGGGVGNTGSAPYATVAGGSTNTASGQSSTVGGGYFGAASGDYSVIPGGRSATTRGLESRLSFAGGTFSAQGNAQMGITVFRRSTSDATVSTLSTAGAAAAATTTTVLPNLGSYMVRANVIAREAATDDTKGWTIDAVVKRNTTAATTTLVGAATVTATGADAGAAAWAATLVANTTLGSIDVQVTGEAAKTIRWVATVYTTEVME